MCGLQYTLPSRRRRHAERPRVFPKGWEQIKATLSSRVQVADSSIRKSLLASARFVLHQSAVTPSTSESRPEVCHDGMPTARMHQWVRYRALTLAVAGTSLPTAYQRARKEFDEMQHDDLRIRTS